MKIKGKEYGFLTSNRALAQFGVLKRRTNFDLNCGGVYGGISSVRRELFDYRGNRQLVQLLLNHWIIIGVYASLKASYEKDNGNASLSRLRFERCSRITSSTILPR